MYCQHRDGAPVHAFDRKCEQQSGNWHVDYEDSRKADGIILLGYGDIPAASLANPPLTTVMQDTRLAGEALRRSCGG